MQAHLCQTPRTRNVGEQVVQIKEAMEVSAHLWSEVDNKGGNNELSQKETGQSDRMR
jgi:hypothetical protein